MKFKITLFFLLFLTQINAQSVILLEEDSVSFVNESVDISGGFEDFPLDLYFKNNTNESISVKWRREFGANCPFQWEVITADQFNTYIPEIDEAVAAIPMTAVDSHFILRQVFWPKSVAGCCDVKMIFFLEGDPDNPIDTGYYHIELNTLNCLTTSVLETEVEQINFYPNPTTGVLNIKNDYLIESIEILDFSGKFFQQEMDFGSGQIDISPLQSGIYYFKIRSSSGKLLVKKVVKM